jgi:hypothetical protein
MEKGWFESQTGRLLNTKLYCNYVRLRLIKRAVETEVKEERSEEKAMELDSRRRGLMRRYSKADCGLD